MDGHHDFSLKTTAHDAPTEAIAFIAKCLVGERRWEGEARAFGGFIRRRFTIVSAGEMLRNEVLFKETLTFDDGEVQHRSWRLFDTPGGVSLEADDTFITRPGVYSGGVFEISYKIKMGLMWFGYNDVFELDDNNVVHNRGIMTLAGMPVMKIKAVGHEV